MFGEISIFFIFRHLLYKQKFIFYNQEYKTLHQWCQDLNLPYDAVRYQMRKYNKSFEEAIKIGKNK